MHLTDHARGGGLGVADGGLMEKRLDHSRIRCLSSQTVGSHPGKNEKTMGLHEKAMKR
jgi:hypothetical protein